jgi:D-lactate dehydrogenase (cytochrome)
MEAPSFTRRPVHERALAEMKALLGDRLSTGASMREHHSRGETWLPAYPPDAVVFPETTDEVVAIVNICAGHEVPIVPFGAGSSLEGHIAAIHGGVSMDLTRMNRVLRVSAPDLDATVEAGVTHRQLNRHIRHTGLFFSVDPGADATIGGMTATRASGTTTVRYGTMRENVLGLTVVLADGRVIAVGGRARKSASGYDLTRLFVGSEGTLGVITEVTVRLHGRPEALSVASCSFATLEGAVDTVIATIQLGIPVARMELLDDVQVDSVNRYAGFSYPVAPMLFFEFHGASTRSVEEQAEAVRAIANENGGSEFQWATSDEERGRIWKARHEVYFANLALRPGARGISTDVSVPISALAECIQQTKEDLASASVLAPLVAHAGDGNFHLIILIDPDDPREVAEAQRINERMVRRAQALGGTCTGEHGVGFGKLKYLQAEHGAALDVMRSIKRALDPGNIMNPGKLIP